MNWTAFCIALPLVAAVSSVMIAPWIMVHVFRFIGKCMDAVEYCILLIPERVRDAIEITFVICMIIGTAAFIGMINGEWGAMR